MDTCVRIDIVLAYCVVLICSALESVNLIMCADQDPNTSSINWCK